MKYKVMFLSVMSFLGLSILGGQIISETWAQSDDELFVLNFDALQLQRPLNKSEDAKLAFVPLAARISHIFYSWDEELFYDELLLSELVEFISNHQSDEAALTAKLYLTMYLVLSQNKFEQDSTIRHLIKQDITKLFESLWTEFPGSWQGKYASIFHPQNVVQHEDKIESRIAEHRKMLPIFLEIEDNPEFITFLRDIGIREPAGAYLREQIINLELERGHIEDAEAELNIVKSQYPDMPITGQLERRIHSVYEYQFDGDFSSRPPEELLNHQTKLGICCLLLSFITLDGFGAVAVAQEQTVTLAFYQGLNLEQDEVVNTPEAISVVFCGAATEPFVPTLDRELFAFPPAVDLFLPYHPQPDQVLWLAAGDGTQVMLLPEIPFEQVTLSDLVSGDWQPPDVLSVPEGTTIVLRTAVGHLYALRLTPQAGTTDLPLIEVTYRPLFSSGPTPTPGPTVVPEPGSGLLVLLGLALLLGWWRRNLWLKKTGGKSAARTSEEASGTLTIFVVGLALLGLMLYQTVIAQETCVLTVTIETVGRGQVIGTDFVCDEQCSLSYQPGEALNLKAVPAEGSLFVEWRLEGEPVAGIFRLHGDAALTAVFTSDGSTPEFSVCDNSYANALDVLRAYQPQAVAAPPEGMSLWFKADAIQLDDLLDGWVQRWPDASEQANHATQSELARQPRYRPNALNGWPVVEFDGQADRLIWEQSPGSGEFMLFVAARTDDAAAESRRYLLGPQSLAYNDHTLIGLYTDRLASYQFNRSCNNWGNCTEKVTEQVAYAGPVGAQPVLMALESQYNELDLWLNGVRIAD